MTMKMREAFDAQMLSPLVRYSTLAGSYDANNVWVDGLSKSNKIYGVVKVGNKFSQFEEGIALHAMDGGNRFSDYRTLYVTDKYPVEVKDHIKFLDTYYNVLQRSDESVYGFNSYLLEKAKNWSP